MNTENHYQETDLGNIAPNPRGEYSESETYEYLDYVYYQGGSYLCLAELGATITGVAPEPGKITEHWQAVALPGGLTPEYIAMHDRVVNLSEQVEADAEEVRTAEQNVSGMELNITQMQEQTRQAAEAAEQSKDSSAGYAASADASRQAAEESEQNINAQITGFDVHVAEKTEEAENDIEAVRIAANKAIIAQQEQSMNEVSRVGIEAVSKAQAAAQVATEKASEAAVSEKNAKASETAAKLSETNAAQMAEQVATDKEQVAYDRTAVENAKQEMAGSVAQIDQNTQGISELKGDITRSKEAIKDLTDKKITKFYANNLGETTLNDSDNGHIVDMKLYGRSLQDGTPTPDNPVEIKSVVNPKLEICGKNLVNKIIKTVEMYGVTITNNGDGTYTLNGTNTSDWNAYDILKIKFNKNKTIRLTGGNGYARVTLWDPKHNKFAAESFGSNQNVTVTLDPFIEYSLGILITDLTTFDNVVIKPMISTVITDTYDDFEPYKGNKYTLPYTLNAIPVSSGGNVTIDGQEYIADYVDVERGKRVIVVDDSKLYPTVSITDNTDLLLDEPIEVDLTPEEAQMLRDLATNYPTTNVFVTSDQLDGYTEFNYPVSLAEGWNYIKQQFGDTRDYIYDMDLQSAEAYVNSEYAVALAELEV